MSVILILSSILTLLITSIYLISTRKFNYWKKKNVPHLKPKLILGNYGDFLLMKKPNGLVVQEICQAFPNEPYIGAYYGTEPALIVQDAEIIKLITIQDFSYFNSREVGDHTHKEDMSKNIFSTNGDRWKVVRQHMTPLFTSSKMKNMFHLIEKCSHEFERMLDREFKMSNVQEVRALTARFTMDCIVSCGFGLDANTMGDNSKENPFTKLSNSIFEVSNLRFLAMQARNLWPSIFYGLGLRTFPKSIDDFFHELITNVFKQRQYTPTSRNDFVDLIMNWTKKDYLTADSFKHDKEKGSTKISLKVDDKLLVAQCSIFFGAGHETSATTLSYTLFELAKNPEAQKRAIEEVDAYLLKNNNKLGYDCVTELPFLEACLDETLRLYPVLSVLTREVVEDYTLPTGLHLDKGVRIHLPLYHLHHNPDNFPEPEKYRPERFVGDERKNIKPYTYMPFGEGGRTCIGMRFSKMQTLSGLVTFLKKYRVELAKGTSPTVEFEPRALVFISKNGINLQMMEREGWEKRLFAK
uniref:unspecific monooxygenase n=1 Tax=Depressaria pastinacella TaxID=58004 RepID=Q7YZS2_DEPPA|nr:cytochrome P450 [Depressaria pastinacella]